MRRKADYQEAITTKEEAAHTANEYAALTAEIAAINAERLSQKAAIDKDCDERIAHRSDLQKSLFMRLKTYWEAYSADYTLGKKRSAELAGIFIGVRTTPHSLNHKGMTIAKAVEFLLAARWAKAKSFVRVKYSLDKDAIIAALKGKTAAQKNLDKMGFTLVQKDEFFIDISSRIKDKEALDAGFSS